MVMKRVAVGGVLVIVLGYLGVEFTTAQDFIYTGFSTSRVYPLALRPCGDVGLKGPVAPEVYDTTLWLFYTCNDDRVIPVRFFNPIDNAHTVAAPVTAPPTERQVELPLSKCPGNFVAGIYGGCVPPDHPMAPKK